jgi:hypothetical protein
MDLKWGEMEENNFMWLKIEISGGSCERDYCTFVSEGILELQSNS